MGHYSKDVFVSYKSDELNEAITVVHFLESHGISCWIAPRNIPVGSSYIKEITRAIKGARIVVLIYSAKVNGSLWIPSEIQTAFESKKTIIPYRLDNSEMSEDLDIMLRRFQTVNSVGDFKKGLKTLTTDIKKELDLSFSQMNDIFVSYSRKDSEIAEKIIDRLEEEGIECFNEPEVLYGSSDFMSPIRRVVTNSKVIVYLSSQNSNASSYVKGAVGYAFKRNKPVIPVLLDSTVYPRILQAKLDNIETISMEEGFDQAMERLISKVKAYIK